MEELFVRFLADRDGPRVRLELATPEPERWLGLPLELSLEAADTPAGDPVLVLAAADGRSRFRSSPLPGTLFAGLRRVWERRRAEGLELRLAGAEGKPLELASPALDFTGAWARARRLEAAGKSREAAAQYRRSPAPGAAARAARLDGTVAPGAGLDDEAAVRTIMRAVLADGAVDPREREVLRDLGRFFPLPSERIRGLAQAVLAEPRPKAGKPLVAQEVLRALVRRALSDGKIGPGSSQVLNRAARALGLTREQILAMLGARPAADRVAPP